MKKLLTALCLGLWVGSVGAETKWITARDLDNQALKQMPVKLVNEQTVRLEQANWNTWLMCTLPEVWNAENPDEVLENAAKETDPEKRWVFSVYIREHYKIMENYYSDEEYYEELSIGGPLLNKYHAILQQIPETERKATLVKDCKEDWGKVLREKRKALGYQD